MRKLFIISALLLSSFSAQAQNFDDYFEDKTLRLDYTFAGDATRQQIFLRFHTRIGSFWGDI